MQGAKCKMTDETVGFITVAETCGLHFTTDAEELSYLNGKEFTIEDVWFKNEFLEGTLKR